MSGRSWREDPELVRDVDEQLGEELGPLDERWRGIFDVMIPQVLGGRMGSGIIGMGLKLMLDQARRFVARDPEGARQQVIFAARAVASQLRIEPHELYPDAAALLGAARHYQREHPEEYANLDTRDQPAAP